MPGLVSEADECDAEPTSIESCDGTGWVSKRGLVWIRCLVGVDWCDNVTEFPDDSEGELLSDVTATDVTGTEWVEENCVQGVDSVDGCVVYWLDDGADGFVKNEDDGVAGVSCSDCVTVAVTCLLTRCCRLLS